MAMEFQPFGRNRANQARYHKKPAWPDNPE